MAVGLQLVILLVAAAVAATVRVHASQRGVDAPPKKTEYPLYAIGSADQASSAASLGDLKLLANSFHYVQGRYNATQLEYMHGQNPYSRPLLYVNSEPVDGYDAEHITSGRLSMLSYCTGYLVTTIGKHDTTIQVMVDDRYSPLKASTSDGNYSNATAYVIFIRLGEELMKVTEILKTDTNNDVSQDAHSDRHLITVPIESGYTVQSALVVRGFDSTVAVEHDAKTPVLVPTYSRWPGMSEEQAAAIDSKYSFIRYHQLDEPRTPVTYIVDPASLYASSMLSNSTVPAVQEQGYAGSWYDCFTDGELRPVDVGGKALARSSFWNSRAAAPYGVADFDAAQRGRLTRTWRSVRAVLGFYPTVVANNVVTFYFDNGRNWLIPDPSDGFRPLDGFCLEDFVGALDPAAGGFACKAPSWRWTYSSTRQWMAHVQIVMNASQSNLAVLPMMANAGCKSVAMESLGEERVLFERYAYASFLLAVEKADGPTMLGIPAYYQENGTRYVHVDDWFYLPIGAPKLSRQTVEQYQVSGHTSFLRPFANGAAVVNPCNSTDTTVPLGGSYFDPDTRERVTHVDAGAYRGYVFLSTLAD